MNLDRYPLSTLERDALQPLLAHLPNGQIAVEQLWELMDQIWRDSGCDERRPETSALEAFYRHPVWLLNGLFVEQDSESLGHRKAIAAWIAARGCQRILDIGGGFGTLARSIAAVSPALVDVWEPHPSACALKLTEHYASITYVEQPQGRYDCVISTDVIEHVPQPLDHLRLLVNSTGIGGYILLAPCFEPVIRCHLPCTFHLRHTLGVFARLMGLSYLGRCKGSHALIFRRTRRPDLAMPGLLPLLERCSQLLAPLFDRIRRHPA